MLKDENESTVLFSVPKQNAEVISLHLRDIFVVDLALSYSLASRSLTILDFGMMGAQVAGASEGVRWPLSPWGPSSQRPISSSDLRSPLEGGMGEVETLGHQTKYFLVLLTSHN